MLREPAPSRDRADARLCVLTGVVYPGVVTGLAQLLFPAQANGWLVDGATGESSAARSSARRSPSPSTSTRGRRRPARLRRHRVGRHQQGPDRPQAGGHADRAAPWRSAIEEDGAVQRTDSRGHGDGVGVGPRSGHLARRTPQLQVARVARARGIDGGLASARSVDRHVEGRAVRLLRRAARERAAPQHRARQPGASPGVSLGSP